MKQSKRKKGKNERKDGKKSEFLFYLLFLSLPYSIRQIMHCLFFSKSLIVANLNPSKRTVSRERESLCSCYDGWCVTGKKETLVFPLSWRFVGFVLPNFGNPPNRTLKLHLGTPFFCMNQVNRAGCQDNNTMKRCPFSSGQSCHRWSHKHISTIGKTRLEMFTTCFGTVPRVQLHQIIHVF